MNRTNRRWPMAAAVACGMLATLSLHAADPGELFPNVGTYDENVVSVISKPEKAIIQKPLPPVVVVPDPTPPPAKEPIPEPTPAKEPTVVKDPNDPNAPPVDPNNPPARPKKTTRRPNSTQPTTTTAPAPPPPPLIDLKTYAADIMTPMLSVEDQKIFTAEYADPITKAHAANVEQRKKTADLLEAAAQSLSSPGLKRYVLMHAFALNIRASTPLNERVQKAEALLPLLNDRTLPVVQARADALNDLMLTASASPNDRFMDLHMEAHAMLAKLQVQAGFPKDAQDSLKKARDTAVHYHNKPKPRIDQVNEAAAWCDRATAAAALWPKFQATLKTNPDDPLTNTQIATLHLSLYGNLPQAAVFAAKSDRKDMKALAEVLKANPPQSLSKDPKTHAEQVLAIATAMLDVAKATPASQLFDRYSIACYVGDHVEQMIADGIVPAEKSLSSRALLVAAKDVVDKTNLRRGDDLPKWLGGAGAGNNPAAKPVASRTIASVADVFRGIPKDLNPTDAGWSNKQISAVNEWLEKNAVGQTYAGEVNFKHVRQPVDAPGGKVYVPVIFGVRDVQITPNFSIVLILENQMSPKLAAKAKMLYQWQAVPIKGTITEARVQSWGGGQAELNIVITNKE